MSRRIYRGRDNRLVMVFRANDVAADIRSATRIVLLDADDPEVVLADSSLAGYGPGQAFDWSQGVGILVLYLGHEADLDPGLYNLLPVLYDETSPNGIRVEPDGLVVRVTAGEVRTRSPSVGEAISPPGAAAGWPALDTSALWTAAFVTLPDGYAITSEGRILDEHGEPITDETGAAITGS